MDEAKGWKSWMAEPKGWKSWMGQAKSPPQGVVKRDWVATGRIDFATSLNGDPADANQPSEFKLLVEERRIVESIAGNENLEIQWRLATLKKAKAVVTQYHKYLSENSLLKIVVDETVPLQSDGMSGIGPKVTSR
jgi:hypothetical protein